MRECGGATTGALGGPPAGDRYPCRGGGFQRKADPPDAEESGLLTALAAAGGLLIAFTAMPFLDRALPPIRHLDATSLPLNIRIEPDLRILGFSLALCVLTALLFGLGPAFQAAHGDFYSSLKAVRSSRLWTGRHILVVVQVALCTFLLTVAGLLFSTFERLRHLDSGFDQDRIITFSLDPTMGRYRVHTTRMGLF